MKKKARLLGLSCIVTVGLLAGCNKDDAATEPIKRDTPVEVQEVLYGSLSDSNRLTGTIIPETEVEVVPKAAGEFKEILVKKGDVVKTGDVLARLDDAAERNAVQQQEAALKQAQSGLKSAQSSLSSAQSGLNSAKSGLNSAQSGKTKAEQSYAQSQAAVRQGEASLAEARKSQNDNLDNIDFQIKNAQTAWNQAKQNLERMKTLHEEGLISQQNYEDAVTAETNAKVAYDQVVLNKNQAGSDISLKSLEASVDQARIGASISQSSIQDAVIGIAQAQATVGQAQAGVEQAQAGIEQAQASVEQAQLAVTSAKDRLADKVITATASGEVINVSGEVGAMASGQQPFATIVSIDKVKVSANILPAQIAAFKTGDAVNIEISGLNQDFTGIVSYVSAVSSGSGLFTLEAVVENGEQLIRPGMVATIIVNEVLEDDTLLVPTTAVIEKDGNFYVFIITDGKAIQSEVEVLRYGTDSTAVTGDISQNQQVVTKGQNLLNDGDSVQIMEED